MLKTKHELVFIEKNEGVSNKSGNPYCFIKFANPKTFENFNISAELKNNVDLSRGELVHAEFILKERFNNTNVIVTDIQPTGTK